MGVKMTRKKIDEGAGEDIEYEDEDDKEGMRARIRMVTVIRMGLP